MALFSDEKPNPTNTANTDSLADQKQKQRACPIAGCVATIAETHIMCARHWDMVPAPLQLAVGRYDRGSLPYDRAVDATIAAATRKQADIDRKERNTNGY